MRKSNAIQREIDKLENTLQGMDAKEFSLKQRIKVLENTHSKALHREELERDGVFVNIVSVERQGEGVFSGYLIKTECGLHWITRRKLKLGKRKVTRKWRDSVREINEEFSKRKVE